MQTIIITIAMTANVFNGNLDALGTINEVQWKQAISMLCSARICQDTKVCKQKISKSTQTEPFILQLIHCQQLFHLEDASETKLTL